MLPNRGMRKAATSTLPARRSATASSIWFSYCVVLFPTSRQRCASYRGARRCSACRLKREIKETRHGEAARIATGVPGLPTWRRALAETALRRAVEKLGLI